MKIFKVWGRPANTNTQFVTVEIKARTKKEAAEKIKDMNLETEGKIYQSDTVKSERWHGDPICEGANIISDKDCPRCSVCFKKVSL